MIEAAVELDETAMEAYLDGTEPDFDTLQTLLRKAVLSIRVLPGSVWLCLQEQGRTDTS